MIEFTRTSNTAIELKFDAAGLQDLIDAMRSVLAGTAATIEASFDMPIVTLKRSSPKKLVSLSVVPAAETTINKQEEIVIWSLFLEDADCALHRFLRCQESGAFYPAEFLFIQTRKNKNSDFVFCELV